MDRSHVKPSNIHASNDLFFYHLPSWEDTRG